MRIEFSKLYLHEKIVFVLTIIVIIFLIER